MTLKIGRSRDARGLEQTVDAIEHGRTALFSGGQVMLTTDASTLSRCPQSKSLPRCFRGSPTVAGFPLTRAPMSHAPEFSFRYGIRPVALRVARVAADRLQFTAVATLPRTAPAPILDDDDHVLADGAWYPLDQSDLEAVHKVRTDLGGPDGIASFDAYPLLYRGLPNITIIDEVPAEAIYNASAPPSALTATLYPYQEFGYRWLVARARVGYGAIFADEMGARQDDPSHRAVDGVVT